MYGENFIQPSDGMGWTLWSTLGDLFWGISLTCPYRMSPLPTTKQNPSPELVSSPQSRVLFHKHAPTSTSWCEVGDLGLLRNFCYYVLRNLGYSISWRLLTSLNFFVTKDKFLGLIRDRPKGVGPPWAQTIKHTALILRQEFCVLRDLPHTDGPATGSH